MLARRVFIKNNPSSTTITLLSRQNNPSHLIILSHGFAANEQHHLFSLSTHFLSSTMDVCYYREHNNPTHNPTITTNTLSQIIDWSKKHYQTILLWGYSLGASITIAAATTNPVDRIMLWNPFFPAKQPHLVNTNACLEQTQRYKRLLSKHPIGIYQTPQKNGMIHAQGADLFYPTDPNHVNEMSLASYYQIMCFNAAPYIKQAHHSPILICTASRDEITPIHSINRILKSTQHKMLHHCIYTGTHFAPFLNPKLYNQLIQLTKKWSNQTIRLNHRFKLEAI
jgi:pimeloyl-ACP methyl ester carboxylesterase